MQDPSWIERILLILLLVGPIALFWKRFGAVVDIIRRARKTPDFELHPIGRRIGQFLWEVMLQGKVIRERPLPGIAHAFVFWGFCAFALVTVNHVLSGLFGPLLTPESA